MGLLHRKSRWERLVAEPIGEALDLPKAAQDVARLVLNAPPTQNERGRRMGLLHRKSRWERLVEPIGDALDLPKAARNTLGRPPKALRSGLATAGGMVALTAGSAVVSSVRRRGGGSGNDS